MSYDYPELYYRIYPKISTILDQIKNSYSARVQLTDEEMEEAIDSIYYSLLEDFPELEEDPYEKRYRGRVRGSDRKFYGRARLIRELISLLLINEIIRRNKSFNLY